MCEINMPLEDSRSQPGIGWPSDRRKKTLPRCRGRVLGSIFN
jgi:hypothetical protein